MPNQNDTFQYYYTNPEDPATRAFAISANESANTDHTTRAVYVGVTGNLVVELSDMVSGNTVTFTAVPAGTILPIRVRKMRTSSTANSVIGLY
jgi:fructose-1,6-bisphosphatase/sedoheptulose 1,7-bisphosphatase-like protein